jgi:hypothetical protein
MASTTFSGPVTSTNGFITGTSASPLAVTTANQNVSSAFVTTSATTGDTRLMYDKLTFTSTGSGETARFFSVVTGTGAATGGTINGAHISCEINGSTASISGAANALRATLGGTDITPGGTLGVLQLDTNFAAGVSTPATSSFIRVTDSGAGTGKINNLLTIDAGPAATIVAAGAATPSGTIKKISIQIGGVAYYILAATVWS